MGEVPGGPGGYYYTNLWSVSVSGRTGEPIAKPVRITNWAENSTGNLRSTADGKHVIFRRRLVRASIYIGELERKGRLKPPQRLSSGITQQYPFTWTPDSKSVIFDSDSYGRMNIFKQSLTGDPAEPLVTGPEAYWQPRISPDGTWLLYMSAPTMQDIGSLKPVHLMRVPLSGGTPQMILTSRDIWDYRCPRRPGSACIISEQRAEYTKIVFTEFDPVKGRGRELTTIPAEPGEEYRWDISPDGTRIAILRFSEQVIRVLSVTGRVEREIRRKERLYSVDWSMDGRNLFVSSWSPRGVTLLSIDLEGHAYPLWEQRGSSWTQTWAVPSPDGNHLAICAAPVESNVWMMDNF